MKKSHHLVDAIELRSINITSGSCDYTHFNTLFTAPVHDVNFLMNYRLLLQERERKNTHLEGHRKYVRVFCPSQK